ncbi:hypothetical protein D3C76_1470740 [compost metagenome]
MDQSDVSSIEESIAQVKDGLEALVEMSQKLLSDYTEKIREDVAEFEASWQNDKLDMVPGDKVIDAICKNYGVRYKKKQNDAELLTNSIPQNMWPSYLTNLIDESLKRFIL